MLKIGICEDQKNMTTEIRSVLSKCLFSSADYTVSEYTDGTQVIEAVENQSFQEDLLLLDIHMKHSNGLEVAQYIRSHKVDVDIIFITVSKDDVFEAFTYKAFAYWLKPFNEERIQLDLKRYLSEKNDTFECLTYENKKSQIQVPLYKILYLESEKRKINVYTANEVHSFYAKMEEIQSILPEEKFMRCHQSYIVNKEYVESIERTQVIVKGHSIPVSRKYHEQISQKEKSSDVRVTSSLAMNKEEAGAIVFVAGELLGCIFRIREQKEITIGRNVNVSDIVMNNESISRLHCEILYDDQKMQYRVKDCSQNGTYFNDGTRLKKEEYIYVDKGTELLIGDQQNAFRLG